MELTTQQKQALSLAKIIQLREEMAYNIKRDYELIAKVFYENEYGLTPAEVVACLPTPADQAKQFSDSKALIAAVNGIEPGTISYDPGFDTVTFDADGAHLWYALTIAINPPDAATVFNDPQPNIASSDPVTGAVILNGLTGDQTVTGTVSKDGYVSQTFSFTMRWRNDTKKIALQTVPAQTEVDSPPTSA